ncbi:nucleoside diphosphate kinase II, chloroplastic [Cryptomeria japonica]|uniref:nucleoside diphosphate kinase II, chloroplastic n=1 Tax=Cryptomeria japonica TaxID=3369 RepID=UPI0025AB77B0|nr:nucleoside diphosphate kinase II, chloroplastic [Cryptomeria japonica]
MEASITSTASASRGLPKLSINGYSSSGGSLRQSSTSRNALSAFRPPELRLSSSLRVHFSAKGNLSDGRNQAKPFLFLSHLVASMETVEKSYIMIKPDGVQRGLVGDIISRFERKGFVLKGLKLFQCPTELAEEHYKDLKSKPFFPKLVKYITSGPVVCMAWEGPGVVASARKLIGITNPLQAEPGTIRGDFAIQTGRNVVHGSDSAENGEREIGLWFKEGELCEWTQDITPWLRE